MPTHVVKKGHKTKQKFIKKFGDDSNLQYPLVSNPHSLLTEELGTLRVEQTQGNGHWCVKKPILIGNIRMGYGHYRIAMAIASAAKHLGYTPLWFDMSSFESSTGSKVINHLNKLYSLGSRLSQKSKLFNRFYWDPLNSHGFLKLSYNSTDQRVAELMAPIFESIPKHIPFVGTHTWTAQAAVHANMDSVVNVIPDNWPMGLHLAEGSIHTVQTPSSYMGYKTLHGMSDTPLKPMPEGSIENVGHYVDHELLADLKADTDKRLKRVESGETKRILLTIGGAGAQYEMYRDLINQYKQEILDGKVCFYVNVGDHKNVFDKLVDDFRASSIDIFANDWQATKGFAARALNEAVTGVKVFYHQDLYQAVYATNLLMRSSDILVTKPSELSFYPVPKLMMKRVGGHEAWGAIRAAEVGDGTVECTTPESIKSMLKQMLQQPDILREMNQCILQAHEAGIYNGAYKVVELATKQNVDSDSTALAS